MNTSELKKNIAASAVEITRLHARIHETVRFRDRDPISRDAWTRACAEFHARYIALAFPGGYEGATKRILEGERASVEAALCFLELRPYFFRSGYMYKDILRKAKRAPLSPEQSQRLEIVLERDALWREKRGSAPPGLSNNSLSNNSV